MNLRPESRHPEQALGYCKRMSIAAAVRPWFSSAHKRAVSAERHLWRVFNYG
jgi:hypothetical protein